MMIKVTLLRPPQARFSVKLNRRVQYRLIRITAILTSSETDDERLIVQPNKNV